MSCPQDHVGRKILQRVQFVALYYNRSSAETKEKKPTGHKLTFLGASTK